MLVVAAPYLLMVENSKSPKIVELKMLYRLWPYVITLLRYMKAAVIVKPVCKIVVLLCCE